MKVIVGLGNPGKKYAHTRHNAGWLALEALAGKSRWQASAKAQARYCKAEIAGRQIELLKPTTYMNNSGLAVAYVLRKHHLKPADLMVVHDDKDIALGEFKIQVNRGAAGHNGVQSIIDALGTKDFARIRIGIAPPLTKGGHGGVADARATESQIAADFVLGRFTKTEAKIMPAVIERVREEVEKWVKK